MTAYVIILKYESSYRTSPKLHSREAALTLTVFLRKRGEQTYTVAYLFIYLDIIIYHLLLCIIIIIIIINAFDNAPYVDKRTANRIVGARSHVIRQKTTTVDINECEA